MKATAALIMTLLAGTCFGIGPDEGPPAKDRPEDVKAIEALTKSFIKDYNKGDAKALGDLFDRDAELVDEAGESVQGRAAIVDWFTTLFADNPGGTLEATTEALRFLGPDLARETGRTRTITAKEGAPTVSRYSVLYVRRDGKWLHSSVEERPDTTLTPHERLKELDWMLGEWVDESDEGVVHTTCHWSDDQSFLLRDFKVRAAGRLVLSGTQRIGWDPQARQFRSWVFDSEGGFNAGTWTRAGDRDWMIKVSGVAADGKSVSATHVLTFVSKDTARWKSVERTIGGQTAPDVDEVVLVRQPPRPK